MSERHYVTVDVFTDRRFGGNPLAVVLDAQGLQTADMQAIAAEFNYAETTFVLPPRDPANTAQVRIFSPCRELRFAGHPNVGTATVLAWRTPALAASGKMVFEEMAGLVAITLMPNGAELTAPEPLSHGSAIPPHEAAACLTLGAEDVVGTPIFASVGMPFLMVEIASAEALTRARPNQAAHEILLPMHGAIGAYGYVRQSDTLRVRMFAPLDGIPEDPATGSAAAAIAAHLCKDAIRLTIHQGAEMGRPSLIHASATRMPSGVIAKVGGTCVKMFSGTMDLVQ